MKLLKNLFLTGLFSILCAGAVFAQGNGSISGTVTDAAGAVIPGATVTAVDAAGKQKQVIANTRGEYSIPALPAGKYTLKAIAKDFGLYENPEVVVTAGAKNEQFITLIISEIKETVDVNNNMGVSTDPDQNKDAQIISGKDLEALPDDPDEMQAALLALVGASAGPNGGQIYIDGFTGGQMPSKESIREIRINSNPFSAEYDRPGNGRIEILTRPGSDKWRGGFNGNFNNDKLNSRNPFADNRAVTRRIGYGGNISGPLQKKKSSFSLDVNNRDEDNNALINAQILNSSFNIIGFRQDVRVPSRRLSIAPRLDFTINSKNTLVARYSFTRQSSSNNGLGGTTLPSLASLSASHEHEVRITETMIINPKTVDETRFEFSDSKRDTTGDNSIPTINVSSAFTGGGASVGHSFNRNKTWELNNFVSTSFGKSLTHSFKFGGKLRHVSLTDRAENNYAGTFLFQGIPGAAPGDPCDITGPDGVPDGIVSSIEQYRCKVNGGGARYSPNQFTLNSGNPQASVGQYEEALFASDDWKMRPDFLLSVGMRYENQSNIHSNLNFAPRVGFAWSPGGGGAKQAKFVFRGGGGLFYNRFGENSTLNVLRNNGINQINYQIALNDPVRPNAATALLNQAVFTLNGVTNVPTIAQITAAGFTANNSSITVVSPVFEAPYTMLGVFSVERALSSKLTLTTNLTISRSLHQLRTRNINAPVCIFTLNICSNAGRPQTNLGNINQYESGGVVNSKRLGVSLRASINTKVSLFINYGLNFVKSNVSNPIYAYDLSTEYGRDQQDVRHTFGVFGNVTVPWGVSISPNISISSGRPFNITTGVDANNDLSFNERPTFAVLQTKCNALHLTYSFCDISGHDPNSILPRNYAEGPGNVQFNMSFRKNFGFGKVADTRRAGNGNANGGGGNRGGGGGMGQISIPGAGGGGGGRGGGGFGGGGFGGGDVRRPYNLSVGIEANNIFNIVNFSNPVGNLNSSRFGQYTGTAGGFGQFGGGGGGPNRRVSLNLRFNW